MDEVAEKKKACPGTEGMLQDDDEMDIDAQMAQAARSTHTRCFKHGCTLIVVRKGPVRHLITMRKAL